MKKWINYITSILAILLFLVSSTGISYTIHHCSKRNINEFHLFAQDYQCESEKEQLCCGDKEKSICEHCQQIKSEKCCSNFKGYFKIIENYQNLNYQFSFNCDFIIISDYSVFTSDIANFSSYTSIFKSPPIFRKNEISTHLTQFLI